MGFKFNCSFKWLSSVSDGWGGVAGAVQGDVQAACDVRGGVQHECRIRKEEEKLSVQRSCPPGLQMLKCSRS